MFRPPFCPFPDCRISGPQFSWRSRGQYFRQCDGRWVRRFSCNTCERRFSTQTFKADYRWKKPRLHLRVFDLLISKVTMRQIARVHGVRRPTIERRLKRLGLVCKGFHATALAQAKNKGGLAGTFQLDELETYETDRRLAPVTMPVLIERHTYFVVHGESAPLPARGNLTTGMKRKKERREKLLGKRRSGSRAAVRNTLEILKAHHCNTSGISLESDRKYSYRSEFKRIAGGQFAAHVRISSKSVRDRSNRLFPINHTLAMMRDNISRLVRRTWAASKKRQRLDLHFWLWACYRNYSRGITVQTKTTPAQAMGILDRAWRREEILRWRWPQIAFGVGQ